MTSAFLTRLEIKDVVERYFHSLDARDADLLASCFTEDVEARYHTGTPGEFGQTGSAGVVGYLVRNMDNYRLRTHGSANMHVTLLAPALAKCVTHAMAILWKRDRIHFRGLRYEDQFRLSDGEWRIFNRRHSPLWQFDADPATPEVPAPALEMARRIAAGRQF